MPETSHEIKARVRLIRKATPNILEELFEMSNRRCDLCGHEIQDLMLAALEHSTPVISFARSDMPIEEAIVQANDPQNLRCAHASCNSAKNGLTREGWFARGLNEREKPQFLTDGELLLLSFQMGKCGRISGRKHKENGTGVCGLTPEQRTAAGRKGGRIAGRKAVESGQIFTIRTLESCAKDGLIGSRVNKENGTGIFSRTREQRQITGRKSGRKNVENGTGIFAMSRDQLQIAGQKGGRIVKEKGEGIFGMTREEHQNASRKAGRRNTVTGHIQALGRIQGPKNTENGRVQGRKNVESGRMAHIQRIGPHTHWHVRRGIVNPKCSLCVEAKKEKAA